jgi:hypothetical protein
MAEDWLRRFQDFSRTVDFVDDAIFDDVKDLLEKAFGEWRICFFRVLMSGHSIRTRSGNVAALRTIWSQDDSQTDFHIADENGAASTLTSYSLLHCKKLWITAEDGGKLKKHMHSPHGLIDHWPGPDGLPGLPPYTDSLGSSARTLVALPLKYGSRFFGVVNLEFSDALPISSRAMSTATMFSRSMARIIWLHETNQTQVNDSKDAIEQLHNGLQTTAHAFRRRRIFLASSAEEAGGAVIATIRKILETEFKEDFELDYWAEESASGGINDHVRSAIAAAEFGICYLSEQVSDNPRRYEDNPNVLFEAGMFQMLHQMRDSASDADAARWIPIRESSALTGPLPFDIAGDRKLSVPRDPETYEVDTEKFAEEFRTAIRTLMVALDVD